MRNIDRRFLPLLIIGLGHLASAHVQPFMKIITAKGVPNVTVVTPIESDEVLANPGMGFTTQSSVDGDVPGYPSSTIAYYRWYWDELEPLELHTSILNNKSTPIPPEWWPATEKFLKRMGYRLVVRSLRHEKWLEPGSALKIEMEVDNVGVAPPYRAYKPVFEIRKAGERERTKVPARVEADWNVLTWLPGRHHLTASLELPPDSEPGRYLVYFALLDPHTLVPTVKLAVDGRDARNWYSWSVFTLVGKGKLEETLTKGQ